MEEKFYEKTGYIIFSVIVSIILMGCLALEHLGYLDEKMYQIITTPVIIITFGLYFYVIRRVIKDKKLRNDPGEPKVAIDPNAGVFGKPGDAIITIDEFRYIIESPFCKEGKMPIKGDTFYSYLSSLRLIEPISRKMIKWLKKDNGISDTTVDEDSLCYFFRDLRVLDGADRLFLFNISNDKLMLIIAIEQLALGNPNGPRGLKHITALINAASDHERLNYAGGGLLDAFGLFKNGEMKPKIFKVDYTIGYCFLYRN